MRTPICGRLGSSADTFRVAGEMALLSCKHEKGTYVRGGNPADSGVMTVWLCIISVVQAEMDSGLNQGLYLANSLGNVAFAGL